MIKARSAQLLVGRPRTQSISTAAGRENRNDIAVAHLELDRRVKLFVGVAAGSAYQILPRAAGLTALDAIGRTAAPLG